jgi:hypothetical protein
VNAWRANRLPDVLREGAAGTACQHKDDEEHSGLLTTIENSRERREELEIYGEVLRAAYMRLLIASAAAELEEDDC